MEAGLEMRVHDPLWLLARQWQFGEFQGEDAGTPIWAACYGTDMPLALYLPGPVAGHAAGDVVDYASERPLEVLVEREAPPAADVLAANRRLAVEAGQQFLRMLGPGLAAAYRTGLVTAFGIQAPAREVRTALDAASATFIDLMTGRALDGARLLAAVLPAAPADRAAALGFAAADAGDAGPVISAWLDWVAHQAGPVAGAPAPRPTWDPSRMEYACAVAAPGDTAGRDLVLEATAYRGGHLDWYSFDARVGAALERPVALSPAPVSVAMLPMTLSFAGMPASRLWEFEDARVRFGPIDAAPTDLARLLLVEFLVEYGNDFFGIPLDLPAGSVFEVSRLTITTSFGDVTTATPFADDAWRMFSLSASSGTGQPPRASLLFLPPVLGHVLAGPPIEEVHLLRDEMANMAWAVEHVVESAIGQPLDRLAGATRTDAAPPATGPAGTLVYRLDTADSAVPDHWIPLVPEQVAAGSGPIRLACVDWRGASRGRLLAEHAPGALLYLRDEELPRTGRKVTRTHRHARWYDGGSLDWVGRANVLGRGEGTSGLTYDVVESIVSS
jgi:hypothetical protein